MDSASKVKNADADDAAGPQGRARGRERHARAHHVPAPVARRRGPASSQRSTRQPGSQSCVISFLSSFCSTGSSIQFSDGCPSPAENKLLIVQLGGLEPLIRQMLSTNVEVQCNAVGCITNLATHDDNKTRIAKSGALVPLTRLARSKDMRVQRNATGAASARVWLDEQIPTAGREQCLTFFLPCPYPNRSQAHCST